MKELDGSQEILDPKLLEEIATLEAQFVLSPCLIKNLPGEWKIVKCADLERIAIASKKWGVFIKIYFEEYAKMLFEDHQTLRTALIEDRLAEKAQEILMPKTFTNHTLVFDLLQIDYFDNMETREIELFSEALHRSKAKTYFDLAFHGGQRITTVDGRIFLVDLFEDNFPKRATGQD